ncbi:MAG: hypothetical protein Q9184_005558 [Pyrenodesmia sp. 2 TL-2023]
MTRKGRSAFKNNVDPTTTETEGISIQGDETPRKSKRKKIHFAVPKTPTEAQGLCGKGRGINDGASQIAERASVARCNPEVTGTDDEEVEMDIDPPSSDEEEISEDKENQRPASNHDIGADHAAKGIIIFEDTPEAENPGRRQPLWELPLPRPPQDDADSSSETNNSRSSCINFAENRRRAAIGNPSLIQSPLSQPPLVESSTTEQALGNPFAPATPPAALPLPASAPHTHSLGMRIRCYPLSRRPPLEGSDITLPLTETDSSPSIVVQPPSDEEDP